MNKPKCTKAKVTCDPVMVSRVKNYLAENVDKTFVDVSKMARSLKERFREYAGRNDNAFCQAVESAYKVVLQSYGLDGTSTSDASEEESDLEMLEDGPLNEKLLELYKIRPSQDTESTNEETSQKCVAVDQPIDIISSDEEGPAIPKIPKINDQITITPTVSSTKAGGDKKMIKTPKSLPTQTATKRKVVTNLNVLKTMNENEVNFSIPTTSFSDVGGISEILTLICDLILHMKHPEVYKTLGMKAPRGALLHGPPGTGKTLLAYAIAGKLKLPFISVTGTELVGGVSGESERKIRELFERVASVAPSILFVDEIDAICGNRINAQKDMERRMVAQLLASLDGLVGKDPVLVLAATNNPDSLDPALRRAGRLEQEITLGIPSLKTRMEIISILTKKLVLDEDVVIHTLAVATPGFVGADLQALVNKASTYAIRRAFEKIQFDIKNKKEEKEKSTIEAKVTNGTKEDGPEKEITVSSSLPENQTEVPVTNNAEVVSKEDKCAPDPHSFILSLLDNNTPYTAEQLDGLKINKEDFLNALKTTKPSSIREGIVTVPDVTWDDVGSLNEVRKDLQLAILAPVKYPEQMKKLGLTIPSGILLCGPPGCGKTLLAKAVANESGVNFISVKGPELLNMYVGESERAVRTCFRRARNSAPCVIFFDEFDALCPKRGAKDNNGSARVVNQLLTEMDGIESREGVFILAASNRPDIIDPAVLRPGRLDKIMYVGMPNREDRLEILQKLTKGRTQPPLAEGVNFNFIADMTSGYTGADLAGLVRTAATDALITHISNKSADDMIYVTEQNFNTALDKCKPSVSAKEQRHYAKLSMKYGSGSDNKEMELDTEVVTEEMDTF